MPAAWRRGARPGPGPPPAGPFATGFRSAVAAELRRISGQVEPEPEPEGCLFCGDPFDPAISRDPHFCASLRGGRGCQMNIQASLHVDRAGVIRPDLIPLAAFLCAEEYDAYARSIILDHAAAGAPLADLTVPTPDGWVILEPCDLAGAEEALARGGPAPRGRGRDPAPAPVSGGAPAAADPVAAVDGRPTTLAELVDHEALAYRAWGTPEGDFLARQMERLSQLVRWTGADHAGGPRGPHGGLGRRPPPAVGGPRPRRRPPAGPEGGPRPGLRGDPARAAPLRRPLARGPAWWAAGGAWRDRIGLLPPPSTASPLPPPGGIVAADGAGRHRAGRGVTADRTDRPAGPTEASYHRPAGILPAAGDTTHDEC